MTKHEAYDWLALTLGLPREACQIGLLTLDDCTRVSQAVWERFGASEPTA